jgi:hypothetical protein
MNFLTTTTLAYPKNRRINGAAVSKAVTFTRASIYLENPGSLTSFYYETRHELEIDVRKYKTPNTPITKIERQYTGSVSSILRTTATLATQSISRISKTVNTQTITLWKAPFNIQSIVPISANRVRFNLDRAVDSDIEALLKAQVAISVKVEGATNVVNNGNFLQVQVVNDDGHPSLTLSQLDSGWTGALQESAAGTLTLLLLSINLTDPAPAEYYQGVYVQLAGHSSGVNSNSVQVVATNQGGNNIIFGWNAATTQNSASGTANLQQWIHTLLSPANVNHYAIGDKVETSGHTSAGNNATSLIVRGINVGGNNLILENLNGVAQASPAGLITPYHWVVSLGSVTTNKLLIGSEVIVAGASNSANNGRFFVRELNRGGAENVVIYNFAGVAQGGAAGVCNSLRAIFWFSSDQSAQYSLNSIVTTSGCQYASNNLESAVKEINRGGGANYNLVLEVPDLTTTSIAQNIPLGRVIYEARSLFTTRPVLKIDNSFSDVSTGRQRHMIKATNGVFGPEAVVLENEMLALDIIRYPDLFPTGPENLVVRIS